jgi:hypothetical protein
MTSVSANNNHTHIRQKLDPAYTIARAATLVHG